MKEASGFAASFRGGPGGSEARSAEQPPGIGIEEGRMGEPPDRTKLGRVALRRRPADSSLSSSQDDIDAQFDRSFGATFEGPDGGESWGGQGGEEPVPMGPMPRRPVEPPKDLDLDVSVTAPARAARPPQPPPAGPAPRAGGAPRRPPTAPSAPSGDASDDVGSLASAAATAGVPAIDLDRVAIDLDNLDLLPREVAVRHLVLPVAVREDQIFLAMADPAQRRVVDELEFVTGRQVVPLVALQSQVRRFIDAAYKAKVGGEKVLCGPGAGAGVIAGAFEGAVVRPDGGRAGPAEGVPGVAPRSGAPIDLEVASLPPPPPPAPAPARAERRKRVLVVDDENDIRTLIVRVLREAGLEVTEASKGTEALRIVQTSLPDLLVLDAMLPEIHGFDVCRRIKKSEKYRHIPVIMISAIYRGWRFAHDLKSSYGVDHFMEKPFKINDLVDKVNQFLSGATEAAVGTERELSEAAQRELEAGVGRYRTGDIDGAIEHLKRSIDIDPLSHRLHYHLGVLYGKQGNVYLAIHEMESALDIEPGDFSTLRSLAQLYEHAGFRFKAVEMWERAMSACGEDAARSSIKNHLVKLL